MNVSIILGSTLSGVIVLVYFGDRKSLLDQYVPKGDR